ncbi:M23 family metallopeptidase [Streptomyces sp. NPDC051907]|uniref:M23 family metallopeptidase n=1 Tax=Streptomyces sp. NPDC051907 TaxID=3155284 RepID=UPI00342E0ECB
MAAERPAAVEVDPPVAGRWTALNSPADKVPSHGTHAYGQAYAIDIVAGAAEDEAKDAREVTDAKDGDARGDGTAAALGAAIEEGKGDTKGDAKGDAKEFAKEAGAEEEVRPGFRWLWPVVRRNRDFPAFGRPLYAVADATVVHASDGQRDHLSRNSLLALIYLMTVEAFVRDTLGVSKIFGNHVILDLGDGVYAAYAHVQRGSLAVRAGDRVRAGQQLGSCGNSGNSTEPHLHFQLMNGPDLDSARGIPFRWRGVGVPPNGEAFTVTAPVLPV